MILWTMLQDRLSRPEYVHVLINPLPIYGLAVAMLALISGLVARNRVALVAALVLVLLTSLSAWPTYLYGEAAYDRIKAISDTAGERWVDEHMARGERFIAVFYFLASMAFIAVVAPVKWPRCLIPLSIATLIVAMATLAIGAWIAYPGGRVRHKEFRFEPPPAARQPEN
jgi:glucan phosphoethanolaminetransferase (alkaline phosphatase superfamily)